ncbi:MAG: MFS transporter [Clostridia bacterium]|nr:MFS transporter [Clostridia bacterium]
MDEEASSHGSVRELPARLRAPGLAPWQQNLYVLWFGSLIVSASFSLVMPFLPLYLVQLGLRGDPSLWSGVVLAGAFLGTAVMSPVWGSLADRFGQRAMLLRSGFSLAVIYFLMGYAQSPLQLAVLRVLFGMMSGFIPASTALVASNTPTPELGRALGALQTGGAVGGVLGPLFGGVIAHLVGFRGAFKLSAAGLLLGATLAFLFVGERVQVVPSRGVRALVTDLRALLQGGSLRAAYSILFLMQLGVMMAAPVLPLLIASRAGRASVVAVGVLFSLAGVAQVFGSPFTARLARRWSYPAVLAASLAAAGVLMLPQAFAPIAGLAAARLAFGVALAWATVSVNLLVARAAPEGHRGQAFGLLNTVTSLGSMVATFAGGFAGDLLGWSWAIVLSGGFFLVAAALALWATRTGRLPRVGEA